jgi:hypothetical protein
MGSCTHLKELGINLKEITDQYADSLKTQDSEKQKNEGMVNFLDEDSIISQSSLEKCDSDRLKMFQHQINQKLKRDLVEQDENEVVQADLKDYGTLLSYSSGSKVLVLFLFLSIAAAVLQILAAYLLTYLCRYSPEREADMESFKEEEIEQYRFFMLSIAVFIVVAFLRSLILVVSTVQANNNLHDLMTRRMIGGRLDFIEKNYFGMILNRFSKDLNVLDILLPSITILVTTGIFRTIAVVISVAVVQKWILILVAVALIYMVKVTN